MFLLWIVQKTLGVHSYHILQLVQKHSTEHSFMWWPLKVGLKTVFMFGQYKVTPQKFHLVKL